MINRSIIVENDVVSILKSQYKKGTFMPDHEHDRTAISFVLKGSINETVNNNCSLGGIANVVIKPAKTIHNDIYSSDCSIICIYLNNEQKLRAGVQDILKTWNWLPALDNYHFLNQILMTTKEKEQLTLVNDFIQFYKEQSDHRTYEPPPAWLSKLKSVLDTSYCESIRSYELAREFGIHPVYMARVFRKFYGQSIKSYLNVLRINSTMAAIAHQEDTLAHIAHDNGYSDQSHLHRKFKDIVNSTPKRFKALIS